MKIESTTKVSVVLLALGLALCSAAPQGGEKDKSKETSLEPMACKKQILKSYMLRGRESAKEESVPICPSIKHSCCQKTDIQKAYHIVNEIVPARVLEYSAKVKLALSKLRVLHTKVISADLAFNGSQERREFCNKEARKLANFPFNTFYGKLLEELEENRSALDDYYQTFFCSICNAENHPFFNIGGDSPNVMIRSDFCQEFLKNNKEAVRMLNVELIEYLMSLQNVIDCSHYIKSFRLKFFDFQKQAMATDVAACLSEIDTPNFEKKCQTTCEAIQISKIVTLVEGDFEFLIEAVNIFQRFFELKESGSLVSMKLRKFFKKFVIPRKLKDTQQSLFLEQIKADVHGSSPSPARKLAPKPRAHSGRLLSSAPQNDTANASNSTSTNQTNSTSPTVKNTARLVYNRDLFQMYDSITIPEPDDGPYVYRVNDEPIDLDHFPKVLSREEGLNPFNQLTKFSIAQDVLYKLLFTYRKPDKTDPKMMYFLVDFTKKNHEMLISDLHHHFKIKLVEEEPEGKQEKKKLKKKRILSHMGFDLSTYPSFDRGENPF